MQKIHKLDKRPLEYSGKSAQLDTFHHEVKSKKVVNPYISNPGQTHSLPRDHAFQEPRGILKKSVNLQKLDATANIYRLQAKPEHERPYFCSDFKDSKRDFNDHVENLCIGSSIAKPVPPKSVTLKLNREQFGRNLYTRSTSKRPTFHQSTKLGPDKLSPQHKPLHSIKDSESYQSISKQIDILNGNYNDDVLASLRKLSLIEPFIGTTFQHTRRHDFVDLNVKKLEVLEEGLSRIEARRETDVSNSDSGISADMALDPNIPIENDKTNEVLIYRLSETGTQYDPDYFNQQVAENAIPVPKNVTYVSGAESEAYSSYISAVALVNNTKNNNKSLTQRQLSYMGTVPPTATVVDISTGGFVNPEEQAHTTAEERSEFLRSMVGTKASVPPSFYYKRKPRRTNAKADEIEREALKKMQSQAREEIQGILDNTSDMDVETGQKKTDTESTKAKQTQEIKTIQFELRLDETCMRQMSPTKHSIQKRNVEIVKSEHNTSRASTPTASDISVVNNHPYAPNPTPMLEENRFQLFPTANPNTFHVYPNSHSQPTVINMEDFMKKEHVYTSQPAGIAVPPAQTASPGKRNVVTAGRNLATADRQRQLANSFSLDAVVQGSSLNIRKVKTYEPKIVACDEERVTSSDVSTDVTTLPDDSMTSSSSKSHLTETDEPTSETPKKKLVPVSRPSVQKSYLTFQGTSKNPQITPLQSLVVKSCAPNIQSQTISKPPPTKLASNAVIPYKPSLVSGHVSPLKGIRVLRRKITINHYPKLNEEEATLDTCNNVGTDTLLSKPVELEIMANKSNEKKFLSGEHKMNAAMNTDNKRPLVGIIVPSSKRDEPISYVLRPRLVPRFKLSTVRKSSYLDGYRSYFVAPKPQCAKKSSLSQEEAGENTSMHESINVDHLCLEKDSGYPYLFLKEGGSQNLNFISSGNIEGCKSREKSVKTSASPKRRRQQSKIGQSASPMGEPSIVRVKTAAGGGFKSNVAHYSLLLRQKRQRVCDGLTVHDNLTNEEGGSLLLQPENDSAQGLVLSDLSEENINKAADRVASRLLGRTRSSLHLVDCKIPMIRRSNSVLNKSTIPQYNIGRCATTEPHGGFTENVTNIDKQCTNMFVKDPLSGNPVPFKFNEQFLTRPESRPNFPKLLPFSFDITENDDLKNDQHDDKLLANTASIVPDSQTAAYRVSSDLSYDEGSRYNSNTSNNNSAFCAFTGHDEVSRTYQGNTSTRGKLPSSQNFNNHENQTLPTHKEQGRERTSFDPSGSYKEVVPLSLVRIEDRARRSPSANFIPANLSRGQQSQAGTSPSNNVTTFRLHKERQNWSYRMGDLSVNGGGYYGSTPIQPGGRMDVPGLGSLNISSPSSNYNQKLPPGKDKFGFTRSRISSRYGSRYDGSQSYLGSASKESSYSDPCVSAPPSFQQRLTELSLLESDTIKYERNRKLKRKKNSEKDS